MIQCAGSRDRRRLPYCSRILLHDRAQARDPAAHSVPGDEGDDLLPGDARRRRGLRELVPGRPPAPEWSFLRGTPSEVQFDAEGRPVIEVEDVTAAEKKILRPDLVVLSTGMVPANDAGRIAEVLNVDLDEDGFHRHSRPQEPRQPRRRPKASSSAARRPGRRRWWSAIPKPLRSPARSTTSFPRPGASRWPASTVDAAKCIGCDTCEAACPFGAINLIERPADAPRPRRGEGRRQAGRDRRRGLPRLWNLRRQVPRAWRSRTISRTTRCSGACAR